MAEPLPLSLMPGPSGTESRWAPTTTIRFGSPPGQSAMTFLVVRSSEKVLVEIETVTWPSLTWL